MTPLFNKKINFVAVLPQRWLASCNSGQFLIDSSGLITSIKRPKYPNSRTTSMYDGANKEWAVGFFKGHAFTPFWWSDTSKKTKKKSVWLLYDNNKNYRYIDCVAIPAHYIAPIPDKTWCVPSRISERMKNAVTKKKNILFFLDLDSSNVISIICPMNVNSAAFSYDGLTVIAYGGKGYIILDNPLL